MNINAYAKINIGLDVIGKRADGYHEVRMIMQTIDLHDELDVSPVEEPGIFLTTNRKDLPVNEDNLICKAAKLMMDEYALPGGIKVRLVKNIPVAAGLAGGSTDAAAVIRAINELYGLGLSTDEMAQTGVRIGADVPYCIMGGTALSEGIGEILTPLSSFPECDIVLAKPPVSVSTAYVYKHLKLDGIVHPDIDGIITGIETGDIYRIARGMGNVLESVTVPDEPVIGSIKDVMTAGGCVATLMSGSGPSVFGLFDSKDKADAVYEELRRSQPGLDIFITRTYDPNH
ncbi:MAG: 4-(cytidine 5'-diphospho)-2-C-methyl-D-erythritol kinase [Lachnospiraceae bacterium]|nr:4-(cytidine 5'-diphospho)-2-C-methyl-D-erythritol kinase [Lachnospiraceae bacterium]